MRKNRRSHPFSWHSCHEETRWIGEAVHLQEKYSHRSISAIFLSPAPPPSQKKKKKKKKTLGVTWALLDRNESIVTEVSDREKEELNIRQAFTACGYPDPEWTVNKVKQQRSQPKSKPPTRKKNDSGKSKGLVVVPYVQGLSKRVTRVSKKTWFLYSVKRYYLHVSSQEIVLPYTWCVFVFIREFNLDTSYILFFIKCFVFFGNMY